MSKLFGEWASNFPEGQGYLSLDFFVVLCHNKEEFLCVKDCRKCFLNSSLVCVKTSPVFAGYYTRSLA